MKKVILSGILLIVVVVACIFFYKGTRDGISSATTFPKNEAPAQNTPEIVTSPETPESPLIKQHNTITLEPTPIKPNTELSQDQDVVVKITSFKYTSLQTLLTDLSNKSVGKHSSKIGTIIFHETKHEIELLEDIEIDDTYLIKDVTFNLNNHSLTFGNNGFIELTDATITGGNIFISGQYTEERLIQSAKNSLINDCTIIVSSEANKLYILYCNEGASFVVNSCKFVAENCPAYDLYIIGSEGNLTVAGCEFNLSLDSDNETERTTCCAIVARSGLLTTKLCKINVINHDTYGRSYGISSNSGVGKTIITKCNIYTDSHYLHLGDGYGSSSIGISATCASITIDGCTVRGIHSGISLGTNAEIINTSCESSGHGGIYFGRNRRTDANGDSLPATYTVRNSTIAWSAPDGLYKDDFGRDDCSGDNGAGCYIGGSTDAHGITVYMEDCKVIGRRYAVVLRGTSNEHDNMLYIKNTTVDKPMRIDNNTLQFIVGEGCNITPESEVYWNRKGITTYNKIEGTSVVFEGAGAL